MGYDDIIPQAVLISMAKSNESNWTTVKVWYLFKAISSNQMNQQLMSFFERSVGSPSLVSIDKAVHGPHLSYYYSAIFYIYCATFLMYLIWALMLFLEELVANDSTNWDDSGD